MRTTARRIGDGKALKDTMKAQGVTLETLAARTRELDPAGAGVSRALLGFLTAPKQRGVSGGRGHRSRRFRETTSPETATLIEEALNARPGELFNREEVPEPGDPVAL